MSMHYLVSWLAGTTLACYVIREVRKVYREYPKIKQAVAQGDPGARTRLYMQILGFEWISAPLAVIALGFDKSKLTAAPLQLGHTAFGQWIAAAKASGNSGVMGALVGGVLGGLILMVIIRLRSRRKATPPVESATKPWWRKLLPDITTLIPVTGRERLLFTAVALSAGISEEIVFRGWLLYVLHTPIGFSGMTLVLSGAALFGLCHIYQGPTGVVGATAAGVLLTGLYVGTGTLLLPIVLHALIDLRVAVLPSSRPQVAQAQPAS